MSDRKSLAGHKIVILGAGAVGKSAITIRMVVNEFKQEYDATIEDSYTCTINVDGENALLDILDTAGQEQFKALRNHWIREAEAFLLVYAVNSQTSFKIADELYKTVRRHKEDMRIDLVLVGNKCDLAESQHEVTYKMGNQLADSWGVPFVQTSAKTGDNVSDAFDIIVREIRKEKDGAGIHDRDVIVEKKGNGCCVIL
eukprot:152742_1